MEEERDMGEDIPLPEDAADMALLSSGIDDRHLMYMDNQNIPKTPTKKHSVKHVANVETPFKLRAKKRSLGHELSPDNSFIAQLHAAASGNRDKENRGNVHNERASAPDDNEEAERGEMESWFKKKRAGRKMAKSRIYKLSPEPIVKKEKAKLHCDEGYFFPTHFKIHSSVYSSIESAVYLVQEQSCRKCSHKAHINEKRKLRRKRRQSWMDMEDVIDVNSYTMRDVSPTGLPTEIDPEFSILKISRRKFSSIGERERRIKEAKFLSRLGRSRNVVRAYKSWEERGLLFIQMEPCNLGSLKDHMRKLPWESTHGIRKKDILVQTAKGVRAIHRSKIIHLDLKPENIFLHCGRDGLEVKIGDFGISRLAGDTQEIEFDGDRFYMAPELLNNRCSYSSDIYSLGLVFLEILFDMHYPLKSIQWSGVNPAEKSAIVEQASLPPGGYDFLKRMISNEPQRRPTIKEVLLFAKSLTRPHA